MRFALSDSAFHQTGNAMSAGLIMCAFNEEAESIGLCCKVINREGKAV